MFGVQEGKALGQEGANRAVPATAGAHSDPQGVGDRILR